MSECDWDSDEAEEVPAQQLGSSRPRFVLENSEDSDDDLEGWELTETSQDDQNGFDILAYVGVRVKNCPRSLQNCC